MVILFPLADDFHLIAGFAPAALDNTGKNAFSGHNAIAHLLIDSAAMVTFLADLRHFQNHIIAFEAGADRQAAEIDTLHDQVFAKGAMVHLSAAGTKRLDLVV